VVATDRGSGPPKERSLRGGAPTRRRYASAMRCSVAATCVIVAMRAIVVSGVIAATRATGATVRRLRRASPSGAVGAGETTVTVGALFPSGVAAETIVTAGAPVPRGGGGGGWGGGGGGGGRPVGAGIFRTPGIVAARLGSPGLTFVVWVLGAALAFLGALCFAELTTRQPNAAGKYAFVREAFGPRAGFVVGWVEALGTNGVAIAAIGVAAGEFLVRLSGWPPALLAPLGAGLVALFTGLNPRGGPPGPWVPHAVTP